MVHGSASDAKIVHAYGVPVFSDDIPRPASNQVESCGIQSNIDGRRLRLDVRVRFTKKLLPVLGEESFVLLCNAAAALGLGLRALARNWGVRRGCYLSYPLYQC